MKQKVRINDFKKEELPKNRRELFKDILFNHTSTFVNMSLVTALFCLPLVSIVIVFYTMLVSASRSGEPFNVLFSLIFYGSLASIPALIIALCGVSGAFGVAKRLAWGEGLLIRVHFFGSLKDEFNKTLAMSVIVTLSAFAFVVGSVYLSTFYTASPVITGIGIGILAVQLLLVSITSNYFFAYVYIYQNPFFQSLKNCFLMASARLPSSLLFIAIAPGVFLALASIHYISALVGLALFVLFGFGGTMFWTLLSHHSFDKFINDVHYPAYVKRGLYIEETQEDKVG